ncbi:6648_t:CDS:2, partial [Racocetra persica]
MEMLLDIERQDSIPESSELSLPENVTAILPQNYNYMVTEFQQFPKHITLEGFSIDHFELKIFANVDNVEGTHQYAPCKHQGAVATKYNIGSLNFYQSLMPYDCAIFAYIVSGLLSNDHSFYTSLHACTNNKPEDLRYKIQLNNVPQESNKIQKTEILDINSTTLEHNSASFNSFLEIIKHDYENCSPNLQTAFNKFAERYNVAKAKSVLALTLFLYDINHNVNPLARVKSGAKIRVQ